MSDPNGLVYFDGEYHLFYQYNPHGELWGHMSWGHAVSEDLVTWRELSVAIEDDAQAMIFSGSVVVDRHNTSGLGTREHPAMVACYTAHEARGIQSQALAYSTDRGRTWTKYSGNPVLDLGMKDFRDPKVFWHEPTARWVMIVSLAHEYRLQMYGSADLKRWTHLSDFGPLGATTGIWECPDLLRVPVLNREGEFAWMLKVDVFGGHPSEGTGAQIFVGDFDGVQFTPHEGGAAQWIDFGADFYAALSWNDVPTAPDSPLRALWVGWMSCHRYAAKLPTQPWRGAMSLPRQLALRRDESGRWRLLQSPAAARQSAPLTSTCLHQWWVAEGVSPLPLTGTAYLLTVVVDMTAATSAREFGVDVRVGGEQFTRIGVDRGHCTVFVDRSRAGFTPQDPSFARRCCAPLPERALVAPLHLRIYVDASSVEVFVNDGEIVLTEQIFPDATSTAVSAYALGGAALFSVIEYQTLASA